MKLTYSKIRIKPIVFLIYTDQNLLTNTHCVPLEPYLSHTIKDSIQNLSQVFTYLIYGILLILNFLIADIQSLSLFKIIIKTAIFNAGSLIIIERF